MKRLKCPDCGGQVKVVTSAEGHVLGVCAHCAAEFVIAAQGRQHVIVEHRFLDNRPRPVPKSNAPQMSRRRTLAVGGMALVGAAAVIYGLNRTSTGAPSGPQNGAEVLFNVGGEGAGAGQFRDHVFHIGIDSRERAALIDNQDRIYVFGPEGEFITNYAPDEAYKGRFCALLPGGDLIFARDRRFHRVALESGTLLETVEVAHDTRGWNAAYALTSQGGIAVYATQDHGLDASGPKAPQDEITIYSAALKEQRHLTGLLSQAIAHDPMVQKWPGVTAMAVDAAGSIYLNIRAAEDHDPRGGIFEFNADGRLQRRIEVAQAWHGQLAISPDNSLWYADPWRSDLQHLSISGREIVGLSGLANGPREALGNAAALAIYPNGDIGLVTMNHRFARLRPRLTAT